MDITKKPERAKLKSYFLKNSVPRAANFAELIDGTLNQRDDGIVKLEGEPLSVQAEGGEASQKKVINFYGTFADAHPAWSLSLNPRSDVADPKTAKPGWSIDDADGGSKLFIDQNTGMVGVGTITPVEQLDVNGRSRSGTLTVGPWPTNAAYAFVGVNTLDQASAGNYALLQAATGEKGRTFLNSPVDLRFRIGNADKMIVANDGNVGIGTADPGAKLDVQGIVKVESKFSSGKDPASGMSHGGSLVIKSNAPQIDFIDTDHNDWSIHVNANKMYFIRQPWNHDDLVLDGAGNIGIGTSSPKAKLHVEGGIIAGNSDLYFSDTNHNHTAIGNAAGWAAIENAKNYDALMILGRAGTTNGRKVRLWDYLQVHGVFVNSSDEREKRDIVDLGYGLKEIRQLRPVSFNWRQIANPHKSMGLIAQEVEPILGEAVYVDQQDQRDHMSIAYSSLIPVLINAVKELAAEVDRLSGESAGKPA